MTLIFVGMQLLAKYVFLCSVGLIVLSLMVSMWELLISTQALNIELEDMKAQ